MHINCFVKILFVLFIYDGRVFIWKWLKQNSAIHSMRSRARSAAFTVNTMRHYYFNTLLLYKY